MADELKNIKRFKGLVHEIEQLERGRELLQQVSLDLHFHGTISKELRYKIDDYFGYDDSE